MIPNIVNTLGGGSGIDTRDLVNQLVTLQSAPEETRLTNKEELLKTQISDFGLLRSALSNLESSISALGNADTFNAKAVSVPDTSLISLTKINPSATAGTYKIQIDQVAQAQSLASGTFTSLDQEVGTGTLTLRFGNWNGALDTFNVNAERTGAEIVIDDTNNSLQGLRDAINASGVGVQASIVSDGGNFRLQIAGPSGANNEIELVATEDGGAPGLANFEFSEANQTLSEQQEGLDALLKINGMAISRPSNTITDVVAGLEFDIFNSSATEVINLTITKDKGFAETAIRDFVEAYNTFLADAKNLVDFNSETDEFGSLRTDPLADSLLDNIRGFMRKTVPGIDEGFSLLANIGVQTKLDGTLEINERTDQPNTNFRAAIDKHFDLVRDFFTPKYESSDSKVKINGYSARTQPGSYEVVITQQATQGSLSGAPVALGFPIDTTNKDYSFSIGVNSATANITLPDATVYNSGDELAAEIQSLINLNQNVQNAKASVTVTYNSGTGALDFISDSYGSTSKLAISVVGGDAGELGLSVATGTVGLDVQGTVDGVAAFGLGNALLPALGSPAEGLKMIIKPGATSATIDFSRGFGGGLSNLVNNFLANNGLITEREKTLKTDLSDIVDDRDQLERRTEAYRARLESQFLAMDLIVRSLNNTGTFLDDIANRLPFTAKK